MHVHHFNFIVLQPNSINTDTEWAIEKFCINGVPVLIKSKNHLSQSRQMQGNITKIAHLCTT